MIDSDSMGSATAFVIRQTTGPKRTLRLTGRALPYRPFTLSGTMRHDLTWYVGNPNGTLQLLGAAEDESTVKGYWKDRFVGDVAGIADSAASATLYDPDLDETLVQSKVRDLVRVVDGFRREGQLLEVTWGSLVRYGILSKFSQSWHNLHDCEWEMTFAWSSQEHDLPAPVFAEPVAIGDLSQNMLRQAQLMVEALAASTLSPISNAMQKAMRTAAKFSDLSNAMQDLVTKSAAGIMSPYTTAMRIAGIAISAKNSWQFLLKDMWDDPGGYQDEYYNGSAAFGQALMNKPAASASGGQANWQQIEVDKWRREMSTYARAFAVEAAKARERFESRLRNEIIEVYRGRGGENLRDVSTHYYNTPNEWRRIMLYNQLDDSVVQPGALLLIPRITSTTSASQGEV